MTGEEMDKAQQPTPQASASWASSPGVRSRMQLQRSRDTAPELAIRRLLHARGLRYRVDRLLPLPGRRRRADVVFGPLRLAVFVDGCFWHGCPEHGNPRIRSNTWYWPAKIQRNKDRDLDTDEALRALGWRVLRFWEHEDPVEAADAITAEVTKLRTLS